MEIQNPHLIIDWRFIKSTSVFEDLPGHTLQSWPGPESGSSEKGDPGPLEKADSMTKFAITVKKSRIANSSIIFKRFKIFQ